MAGVLLGHALRSSARRGLLPRLFRVLLLPCKGYSKMAEVVVDNGQTSTTRVLFCGYYWPAAYNYTQEYLQNYPFIQVDEVALDDVPDAIHKYHICVVKNQCLDSKVIAKAVEMKLIMQFGVGLEGVDVDAATEHKIKVAKIPGSVTGNSTSCAEMAIYLILGLLKKQKEMDIVIKQRNLGVPVGETLFGKTVFILGFGAIGVDLAKRLRPFGAKILATKRRWSSGLLLSSDVITELVDKKGGPEDMYKFAAEADIVVSCLTLTNETAGIVDGKFLSSMRKGSLLVNIARGGLLDYKSVLQNLVSGHLGGLGIDVAWTEPFDPEDPILKFPNVIITPHVAGVTEYSYRTMAKVVGDCALQLHAGNPLTGVELRREDPGEMNGYSKITSKPRSVDLPDHTFPSLSQPQESPNPTPKDGQKGETIKAHEQIPWQEKDRCKDGQMSGLALTRNFSSTSHRFKAGENSHGSSTLRRAFSMRKPSAVAEGYWRIPDTADGDGDGDLFDGEEQQQQHVKSSSWKKKGRILRACKRLFKL